MGHVDDLVVDRLVETSEIPDVCLRSGQLNGVLLLIEKGEGEDLVPIRQKMDEKTRGDHAAREGNNCSFHDDVNSKNSALAFGSDLMNPLKAEVVVLEP